MQTGDTIVILLLRDIAQHVNVLRKSSAKANSFRQTPFQKER